ncbi:TRAP transporter permease, partial [Vibrio genomosp. F10 str. 9ZD137]
PLFRSLVPLLIAYTSLVSWNVASVLTVGFFAIIGTYAFIGAIEGYLEGELNWMLRAVLVIVGIVLVWADISLWIRLVACGLFIAIFVHSGRLYDKQQLSSMTPNQKAV